MVLGLFLILAMFSFAIWGALFSLAFVGLTLLYSVVAVGVIFALAQYYKNTGETSNKKCEEVRLSNNVTLERYRPGKYYGQVFPGVNKPTKKENGKFVDYLRNNNTWFFVLLGICVVTFVIALFHFGPALLLPEDFPSSEQRGTLTNLVNHLLFGKHAAEKITPTDPLPWATGTWFWWRAFWLYLFLFGFYTPFAWWDEWCHACRGAKAFIKKWEEQELLRKRRQAQQPATPAAGTSATPPAATNGKLTFTEFLRWDLLVELALEFGKLFFEKKRANGN